MAHNSILTQVETLVSTSTALTLGYGSGQTVPARVTICNPASSMTITLPLSTATLPPSTAPDSGYLPPADGVMLTFVNVSAQTVTFAAATGDTLVNAPVLTTLNGAVTFVAVAGKNSWYAISNGGGVGAAEGLSISGLGATSTSFTAFTAPTSGPTFKVTAVSTIFGTASTSGTMQVEKATGTQAVASGTNILTGTMSLSGTAATIVNGTLVATAGVTTVAPGNRLNIILAGTMTSLANCSVGITLSTL